jgi:hypothetical protein
MKEAIRKFFSSKRQLWSDDMLPFVVLGLLAVLTLLDLLVYFFSK